MTVPKEFVIIRHGQSERNASDRYDGASKDTDAEYRRVKQIPDWQVRLSNKGIEQAKLASKAIKRHLGGIASYDALYVSPYVRTFETAAYVSGEAEVEWASDERLSERYWGHHNRLTEKKRKRQYPNTIKARQDTPWYQSPEGGESMMNAYSRIDAYWHDMCLRHVGQKILAVAHHDTIYAAHRVIEDLLPEEWDDMYHGKEIGLTNCLITQWSSVNPHNESDIRDYMNWKRYINPIDESASPLNGQWVELGPKRAYDSKSLLERVDNFPKLTNL